MEHKHTRTSNIAIAFFLNFSFAIIELFGGFFTGSTAILSDSVHDFGDSLALGTSWFFEKIAKRKPSQTHTYGLHRLSIVGALINIIILFFGTFFFVKEALQTLLNPHPVATSGMLVLAAFSIIVNGISVLRMHGTKKLLDKTVMLHLLEDLLGGVSLLIVSIIIRFTNWYILDPILSLAIAVIIIIECIKNTKSIIEVIMQKVPDADLYAKINKEILEIPNIQKIEQSHMWTLDDEHHVYTAIISVITPKNQTEDIYKKIKNILCTHAIYDSTIEILPQKSQPQ
ncbi:MAG: cation diffusion facilitator family transporter [Selenomonadaceae bacterium]